MDKHTPTPWVVKPPSKRGYRYWIFDAEGNEVGILYSDDDRAKANAAFIVRAVNAYEELISMLAFVKQSIRPDMGYEDVISLQGQIAQAIAKAEGK